MRNDTWMRNFLLRCLFGMVAMLGASFAQGGPFDGWGYHAPVTFSGYGQSETLTNFPTLVVLSNACFGGAYAFSYSQFQSGSNDLAFTDADGNSLNYEIETWDPAGTSTVWVQVPVLTNNATVTAWWGAAGQPAPACTTNGSVWSNGYAGVWHLSETSGNAVNAVRCGGDGVPSSVTQNAAGVIGGAASFNGTSAYYNCGPTNSLDGIRSWEGWVNPTSLSSYKAVIGKGYTSGYWFGLVQSSGTIRLHCVGNASQDSATAAPLNQWTHIAATYDDAAMRFYLGGRLDVARASSGALQTNLNQSARIGADYNNGSSGDLSMFFAGKMDEIRVSSVVRSSDWVWAVYQNMASNAVFQSYGTVVASGGSPAIQNVAATNVTQTSAFPNGQLTADGSSAATVTLYWGPTDGGTNAAAWTNAVSFGVNARPTPADYTTNLTGLTSGMTYYYRYCATNDAGSSWASPSLSFTTLAVPDVNNGSGATNVFSSVATLTGTVAAGTPSPSIYVCWGTSDGGTTTSAWQNVVALGVQSGAFSTTLHGLLPGTAYSYRCYAVNSQGETWSPASATFTTAAWTLSGNTLTDGNWSLTVSAAGGNYTITGCSAGSGDLDLRHTGYTITAIGYHAFTGYSAVSSVWLPDSVTSFGDQAFYSCTSLTNVAPLLPGGVTYLGHEVFRSCPITGDLVLTNAGSVTLGGNGHFYGTMIASATLGQGVTSIPYQMFCGCPKLGSVSMSDGVVGFGDSAFAWCTMLTNVVPLLPGGVTSIGQEAFAYSPIAGNLVLTNAGTVTLSGSGHFRNTKVTSATLGRGVTDIPYVMFANCSALGAVSMSDGVTSIGTYAFSGCSSLTNVVPLLPGALTSLGSSVFWNIPLAGHLVLTNAGPITLIGDSQFWATKITSATLGCGVTNIPYEMFWNCTSLGAVSMSDNVQSIGTYAFFFDTSLTNVTPLLPQGLVSLGGAAFFNCPIAGDLVVGNAGPVTFIPDSQFYGAKIASATLGVGVTNLPASIFESCTGLRRVYFCGCPALGSSVFRSTANYQMRTYIPKGHAEWQPITDSQVTPLTADEVTAFQTAYPGEVLPLGTWVPSGAGKAWYCTWVLPQDQHKGTLIRLK